MMKYLDTADNKAYQQYFCNYNEKMFAQLMISHKSQNLQKGDFLY